MKHSYSPWKMMNPGFWLKSFSADSLKKHDLRARTYQAILKFWSTLSINPLGAKKEEEKEDTERVKESLGKFQKDIEKVFADFKKGSSYDDLNFMEQMGEEYGKFLHRSMFWGGMTMGGNLHEVYNAIEDFWEQFFELKGSDDLEELHEILSDFNAHVWDAYEFKGKAPAVK